MTIEPGKQALIDVPSDPVDAMLALIVENGADTAELHPVLREAQFQIAMNGDGRPLLVNSPDRHLCVVVTTAEEHRERVFAPDWRTATLRETLLMSDEDIADAQQSFRTGVAGPRLDLGVERQSGRPGRRPGRDLS